jgi:serine/threonine protein kinase
VAFSVGQIVGDYQVIEILGAGGMGTVYKVRHLISDRLEAMKLVLPELTENPDLADRFMREIKVQARLSHPNIASLHTALRSGNQLLMVMELVDGHTLHAAMRRGPIEPLEAIDITLQILNALEYAHAQQVVHRDIKPANIMITTARTVKLMDFGIARSLAEDQRLTRTGAAVGSIYYMSPEQVQDSPVDARADLYSVGVLLYEMATGVRPINGESSWAVMNGHLNTVPRAPAEVNPGIAESLSLAILMALEKKKEQRFQSARAFADSLLAVRARLNVPLPVGGPAWLRQEAQETALATPSAAFVSPAATGTSPPYPVTPVSGSSFQSAPVRFDPDRLAVLTRELASFVGPIAKVLVNRAAKKAQTWKQLYDALAPQVPDGLERRQFLSKRP